MKKLILILILAGCGQTKKTVYQCQSVDECLAYCERLNPDNPVARQACWAAEVDRITNEEKLQEFLDSLEVEQ